MRWQIALAFKRLKSLIGVDKLPARSSDLARAWLAPHLIRGASVGVQPGLSGVSDIAGPIPPGARSERCKLYAGKG